MPGLVTLMVSAPVKLLPSFNLPVTVKVKSPVELLMAVITACRSNFTMSSMRPSPSASPNDVGEACADIGVPRILICMVEVSIWLTSYPVGNSM